MALSAVVGLTLLASAAAAGGATPASPAQVVSSSQASTAADAARPGVVVTGDVAKPGRISMATLRQLPQTAQTVTYGAEEHRFRGPLLTDVIALAEPSFDAANKNDSLRFAVLAVASDGYAAAVTLGEVDAGFGATQSLLALRQDREALALPRLTVPGDLKGGRYVSDVIELRVVRLG